MASIDIITPPGTIHIELLDNPFVKKWTEHFLKMQKVYQISYRAYAHPVYITPEWRLPTFNQDLLKWLENLRNTIIKLQDMGINFPMDPWKIAYEKMFIDQEAGQQILNEIHRYFTTAGRTMNDYVDVGDEYKGHWSDNFDNHYEFTFNEENAEEFRHLHAFINDCVHELDCAISTPRKEMDITKQIVNLQFYFDNSVEEDCRYLEGVYQDIIEEDYQYASDSEEYNVWVGNDILGKDYIEGYYDHDDPSQWDITPINGHCGKFNINVTSRWYSPFSTDNSIQKLVETDDFKNWLTEHDVEYVPQMCGIPLGKITSGKEFVIRKYFKSVYKQEFQIKVNN